MHTNSWDKKRLWEVFFFVFCYQWIDPKLQWCSLQPLQPVPQADSEMQEQLLKWKDFGRWKSIADLPVTMFLIHEEEDWESFWEELLLSSVEWDSCEWNIAKSFPELLSAISWIRSSKKKTRKKPPQRTNSARHSIPRDSCSLSIPSLDSGRMWSNEVAIKIPAPKHRRSEDITFWFLFGSLLLRFRSFLKLDNKVLKHYLRCSSPQW